MMLIADLSFDPKTTHPLNAFAMIFTGAKRARVLQVFWTDETLSDADLIQLYVPCITYAKDLGLRVEAQMSLGLHAHLMQTLSERHQNLIDRYAVDRLQVVYPNSTETIKEILRDPWFALKQWDYLATLRYLGYVFIVFGVLNFTSVRLNAARHQNTLAQIEALQAPLSALRPLPESGLRDLAYVERHRELMNLNHDGRAWLTLPGTAIDFPVVQSTNNDFYLFHDVSKKPSSYGSIYLDHRVWDLNDTHVVVYGHSVRHRAMFGPLIAFSDVDYVKAHPTIELISETHHYTYQIFSVHLVDATHTRLRLPMRESEYASELARYHAASMHDLALPTTQYNQLITLISCEYSYADGRIFVHGVLKQVRALEPTEGAQELG